ncbi:roadblock/LC7 domain-containing protein [candidate division KSB1 bacterium]|nr:roadblock/LC7 domain-containing protein [candidate division KSB1 bacterium]
MAASSKDPKMILNSFNELPGVIAATVIGRDGFIIESSATSTELDLDALGAVVSTGFGAAEVMGTEIQLGYLTQTIMEFDLGKILTASCGDNILAIVTEPNAIIGNVRHQIKKNITELTKLI